MRGNGVRAIDGAANPEPETAAEGETTSGASKATEGERTCGAGGLILSGGGHIADICGHDRTGQTGATA